MKVPANRFPQRARQRGQALLAAAIVMGTAASMFVFYALPQRNLQMVEEQRTTAALMAAQAALLQYSIGQQYNNATPRPGSLPCPDRTNDGLEDTCTTVARRIARLPYRSLGLTDLRDGAGETLWYAVSNTFRSSSATTPLNSDTNGDYTIRDASGATIMTGVIAVIMAPGPAIATQNRSSANVNTASAYLELENANTNTILTMANDSANSTFNDQLVVLTRDNFMSEVARYVTSYARSVMRDYYNQYGFLPNAAAYGSNNCTPGLYEGRIPRAGMSGGAAGGGCSGPALTWAPWFSPNNWNQLIFYAVAPNCTLVGDAACTATGGLTVTNVSSNARGIVIGSGRAYTGQPRPCTTASGCLEDAENSNGDTVFVRPSRSTTNNDNLMVISP